MIAAAQAVERPFPGIRPFERDESHLFFGRDGQVDVLLERLARSRFLAVVGASGSGKSSLVRAGLLPVLYGDFLEGPSRWRIAVFRPGGDPIGNMARALSSPEVLGGNEDLETLRLILETTLRRSGLGLVQAASQAGLAQRGKLLIVADQFEEIFRIQRSGDSLHAREEAAAFVKLLLEASHQREVPIYVLLTMRSDFLGHCAQFRDLPEALNESQYLIPRMTRDQLRQASASPVAVAGAEITPRLVQRLLNDIGEDQDQLPLLQHALMRTWDYWKQNRPVRPLDIDDYEAVGGMAEALSRHAEEAFQELPDDRSRMIAEKLFQAITEKPPDQLETRRPTTLGEICAVANAQDHEVIAVIDRFRAEGRAFLMPPCTEELHADSVIDISHESLIRQWSRLQKWVREEAESRTRCLRIADAARDFEAGEAGLWRDPQLQLALDWLERKQPTASWTRRHSPSIGSFEAALAFLEKSRQAREEERRRAEAQQRAKQRRVYGSVLSGIGIVLAIVFAALAVWAQHQKRLADVAAEDATRQQKIAEQQKARAESQAEEAGRQRQVAEQQRLRAEELGVVAVAFAERGKDTLSRSGLTVERHQLQNLINEACSRLTRNLTADEWKQYLGDEPYRKTCPNLP